MPLNLLQNHNLFKLSRATFIVRNRTFVDGKPKEPTPCPPQEDAAAQHTKQPEPTELISIIPQVEKEVQFSLMPIPKPQVHCPTTTQVHPYTVKPITSKDHDKVLLHLRNFYFREEPLNKIMKLYDCNMHDCSDHHNFCKTLLNEGHSLMAVCDNTGAVIGAALNIVEVRNKMTDRNNEVCWENPDFCKVFDFLDTLHDNANMFRKYPNAYSVMNTKILFEDFEWRNKNVAKALLEKTGDLARYQGHELLRMDCTNHYNANIARALGYECIYTLKYNEYKVCGRTVFNPKPPHTEASVFIREIEYNYPD